jgi:hypothetical protein
LGWAGLTDSLGDKNVSDQPPDFPLPDARRVEIEKIKDLWIQKRQDINERCEGDDEADQAGDGNEADAPFQFVQECHCSVHGRESGARFNWAACVDTKVAASRMTRDE